MDRPVLLAGLVDEERSMFGKIEDPSPMLMPDVERQWTTWKTGWRTVNRPRGWRLRPLNAIGNEAYTVYLPVVDADPVPARGVFGRRSGQLAPG